MEKKYYCYLLTSLGKTYIGMTNNLFRRLKQHNNLIKGGAKSTRGKLWLYRLVIGEFNRSDALKFEYSWKQKSGLNNRIKKLLILLLEDKWKDKKIVDIHSELNKKIVELILV